MGLGVWQVPDEQAAASVKEALAAGYRSVDTAAIYQNEEGVGAGLRAAGVARKDLFITTKLWNDKHGYDDAHAAMDESLRKLGLAYVDLYLIHWPVAGSDKFLEAWRAMIEMKQDGRARLDRRVELHRGQPEPVDQDSGVTPAVNQIELHPGFAQRELRAFHERHGIATESWSPLAQGKAVQEKVIQELARKHGKTPAQITLRWHLQSDLIVIPKSVTPARIRENIDVFDFELSRPTWTPSTASSRARGWARIRSASANERCAPGLRALRGERASAFQREGPVAHDHAQQDGQRRPGSSASRRCPAARPAGRTRSATPARWARPRRT